MWIIAYQNEHAFGGEGFEFIGPFNSQIEAIERLVRICAALNKNRDEGDKFVIYDGTEMYHQDEEVNIRTEVYAWVQHMEKEPSL